MGTNKSDRYAAMRFSDEGALSASGDPLSRRRYKRLGQEADHTPLRQRKPGNRRHAGTAFAAIRKIRDILTCHPLWTPTTAAASVVAAALPGFNPVLAIASLTSPMMKIRSAANAVASAGKLHGAGL